MGLLLHDPHEWRNLLFRPCEATGRPLGAAPHGRNEGGLAGLQPANPPCGKPPQWYENCYHEWHSRLARGAIREETKLCQIATIVSRTKKTAWPRMSRRARKSAINPKRMPSGSAMRP